MYVDASDQRPRSLFDRGAFSPAQIAAGAVAALGVHVVLPLCVLAALALLTALGVVLGAQPEEPPPVEQVIQAHFLQLGEPLDPHELPNRRAPILRTDTPEPAPNPHARPDQPPPDRHERQRDSVADALQRLSDDAQIFAEREERRVQEGDPNGIEGGERDAAEGDRFAAQLAGFFRRGWSVPDTIAREDLHGLTTVVSVHVGTDLRVESFRVVRPSGNADYDLSVEQQLQRLVDAQATIPEPPSSVAFNYVGRDVAFRFRGVDAH